MVPCSSSKKCKNWGVHLHKETFQYFCTCADVYQQTTELSKLGGWGWVFALKWALVWDIMASILQIIYFIMYWSQCYMGLPIRNIFEKHYAKQGWWLPYYIPIAVVHLGGVGGTLASPLEIGSLQCIATIASKLKIPTRMHQKQSQAV